MLAQGLSQDRYVELLWAMTLGWKTGLSGEVSEPFMRSGTMHVFAISGLHIALIAAILVAATRVFGFRRRTCAFIVIPLIWAYTGATGWQASAIRSTIMSSVIIFGWCLRRPSNLLNSLMAAGFLILLWDPLQLFQAGFQLSFFVVLALALLTPALDRWRNRMLAPEPFLAPQFRTRGWRWWNWGAHAVVASFAVSLVAWLGSLPLIANYFHLLTPITLLANMVVVPLSSGALACNLATLTFGVLCPPAAELFNHCAWFLMVLMVKVSEWAAAIPLLVLHVKAPGLSAVILYYTVLIAVFSGWLFREGLRKWAGGAVAAAVVPFALQFPHAEAASQMTVLPLQGGSAVYVNHKGRWLIDCGRSDAGRLITKPFLQAQGINRLEHLILTHGDVRHVEAAPLIYETFSKPTVYMSPLPFRSTPYKSMQAYFETNCIPTKAIANGDRIGLWEVLHPEQDTKFPQADDKTMVLFGEIAGQRILLLSDLGTAGQNALLTRYPDLRADIVVTGIPNQGEPVADGFLDMVQPKMLVIADAEQQRAREPLRERLSKREIEVLYTSDSGAITFSVSNGGGLRHASMKGNLKM
jgi:ComEC/Rec2-related protein